MGTVRSQKQNETHWISRGKKTKMFSSLCVSSVELDIVDDHPLKVLQIQTVQEWHLHGLPTTALPFGTEVGQEYERWNSKGAMLYFLQTVLGAVSDESTPR